MNDPEQNLEMQGYEGYQVGSPYGPVYQQRQSVPWGLILILVAVILGIIFLKRNGTSGGFFSGLFDKLKELLDFGTGGSDGSGHTGTENLDNPQISTPTPITRPGIQTLQTAAFVAAAQSGALRTGENLEDTHSVDVKFDRKWETQINHNMAYYDLNGRLRMIEPTLQVEDFADREDNSWKNVILRVVTVGLWFLAEYSLPLDSFCYVNIYTTGDEFLRDCQMMWMGNIPQKKRDGEKWIANQIRTGSFYNGSNQIKLANLLFKATSLQSGTTWKGMDVKEFTMTCQRVRLCAGSRTIKGMLSDTGVSFSSDKQTNVDTWGTVTDTFVQMAKDMIHGANDLLVQMLDEWEADGAKPERKPYSIPGCICPTVDTTDWLIFSENDHQPSEMYTNGIKRGRVKPQTWFWEYVNWYQSRLSDSTPKFCYRRKNGYDELHIDHKGSKLYVYRELFALTYYIYLPTFCVFGSSLWDAAYNGFIWGRNMFVGSAGSTHDIAQAFGSDPFQASLVYDPTSDTYTFDDITIDAAVLASKCLPDTSAWLKLGAPDQFKTLLG